jgi:hypothetical protein
MRAEVVRHRDATTARARASDDVPQLFQRVKEISPFRAPGIIRAVSKEAASKRKKP